MSSTEFNTGTQPEPTSLNKTALRFLDQGLLSLEALDRSLLTTPSMSTTEVRGLLLNPQQDLKIARSTLLVLQGGQS